MAVKYPEGYYVYIHKRKTDGLVFYVGIGICYRAWNKHGRNKKWCNIFRKHGRDVELLFTGLTRQEAAQREVELIQKYRGCGLDLANKTDGGDGCKGLYFTEESKIRMSRSQGGRVVHCSNGMSFPTGASAAEWLRLNGKPNARQGHISACARGERTAAYGLSWWYEGDSPKEYIPRYERLSDTSHKGVHCSNGMWFKTQKMAAAWVAENGNEKACQSAIGMACRGILKTAYGYEWKYGRRET